MSLESTKSEIRRFLKGSQPEVLCIRGAWGVGKTYAWTKCLEEISSSKELGLNSYAYVSLFGLNSIRDINQAIFQNTTSGGAVGRPPSLKTYAKNADEIFRIMGRQTIRVLGKIEIPYTKDLTPAFALGAMGLAVRGRIVCLDDIERRGKDLRVKDVLGVVSNLREQKSCRVVLILNEDELGDDKDEFRLYFEKVVDTLICFEPTPNESGFIAIPSGGKVNDHIRDVCARLSICNIRIIRRIYRYCELALEEIGYFDWRVQEEVLTKIAVFVWGRFGDGPSLLFIKDRYHFGAKREDFSDKEMLWASILDAMLIFFDKENDGILLDGVERGYFDVERLRAYGSGKHTNAQALKKRDAFSKAWSAFHHSFESNEDEVADALYAGLKDNYSEVSALNASSVVETLRELGRNEQANELVDLYVNGEGQDAEDMLKTARLFGGVKDPVLRDALAQKAQSISTSRSVTEILNGISKRDWLNPAEEALLSKLSGDDYYSMFMAARGDSLASLIDGALMFSKISNANETQRNIAQAVHAALVRIGSESPLNRRRVARYIGARPEAEE